MPDTDVGVKPTRREAERLVAWMRRGGFTSRIEKRPDGYHVLTTGTNERHG